MALAVLYIIIEYRGLQSGMNNTSGAVLYVENPESKVVRKWKVEYFVLVSPVYSRAPSLV